jgi:hypothetical protein
MYAGRREHPSPCFFKCRGPTTMRRFLQSKVVRPLTPRKHPERVSLTLSGLTGEDMFFVGGNGVNYLRLALPFFNENSGILTAQFKLCIISIQACWFLHFVYHALK